MSTTAPVAREQAVRPFADLSRADVPFAGGKGANLGELTRAGLPVPDGFVVGAPAYAAFCDESGLRARLAAALDGLDVEDTAALEAAAAAAQELVMTTPIPQHLRGRHRRGAPCACRARPPTAVAVRSSATAEDTESASFAGMNETFLNVPDADAVVTAVRRCWASLFGGAHRLLPRQARLPAGRDGHRRRRAAPGPLDARGRDVHDRPVHRPGRPHRHRGRLRPRRERRLRQRLAGPLRRRQGHARRRRAGGQAQGADDRAGRRRRHASRVRSRGEESARAVLGDEEVGRLAELAIRIERHYGAPQDTEWAFDAGRRGVDAPVAPGHVGGRHAGRGRAGAPQASCSSAAWARRRAARAARCGASRRSPTPAA